MKMDIGAYKRSEEKPHRDGAKNAKVFELMNDRAASRAVSRNAIPKNCAASCGVFIIPRKRDELGVLCVPGLIQPGQASR
jgi:hypothetical protein